MQPRYNFDFENPVYDKSREQRESEVTKSNPFSVGYSKRANAWVYTTHSGSDFTHSSMPIPRETSYFEVVNFAKLCFALQIICQPGHRFQCFCLENIVDIATAISERDNQIGKQEAQILIANRYAYTEYASNEKPKEQGKIRYDEQNAYVNFFSGTIQIIIPKDRLKEIETDLLVLEAIKKEYDHGTMQHPAKKQKVDYSEIIKQINQKLSSVVGSTCELGNLFRSNYRVKLPRNKPFSFYTQFVCILNGVGLKVFAHNERNYQVPCVIEIYNATPQRILEALESIKSFSEIRKNSRILYQGSNTKNDCFFSRMPNELLIKIASYTKDPSIHTDEEAEKIAHANFGKPSV